MIFVSLSNKQMICLFHLVSVKAVKDLNTKEEPCNKDRDYDFHKCFESFYYRKQGCQFPRNFYEDLDVPSCNNLTILKDFDTTLDPRAQFSNLRRASYFIGECHYALCYNEV